MHKDLAHAIIGAIAYVGTACVSVGLLAASLFHFQGSPSDSAYRSVICCLSILAICCGILAVLKLRYVLREKHLTASNCRDQTG